MLRQLSGMTLFLGLLSVLGTGCCCVQGMPGNAGGPASCAGGCPPGPLLGLASCRGACGETYVDEWISEPPVVDDCGYGCGGCATCGQPLRTVLRQLWGRPYVTQCSTGLCGPSCGCDTLGPGEYADVLGDGYGEGNFYQAGYGSGGPRKSCNCGSSAHTMQDHSGSVPGESFHSGGGTQTLPPSPPPSAGTPKLAPEIVPSPPEVVAPTSAARRLNPALSRRR